MKILWLCNIVLPCLAEEFGLTPNIFGGWLVGCMERLRQNEKYEIAVCCSIIDSWRMRDGEKDGLKYYSVQNIKESQYIPIQIKRFEEILRDFNPDIVHIWGTETYHSYSLVRACQNLNMSNKIVVNIQGLVSVIANHMYDGVPLEELLKEESKEYYINYKNDFVIRGKYEIKVIESVNNVIGRTTWDKACSRLINQNVKYWHVDETLRKEFYEAQNSWDYDKCIKNRIFITQGHYPVKGLHIFLEAINYVKKEIPNIKVALAGISILGINNDYCNYLKNLIDKYQLRDNLEFVGKISAIEMIGEYERANVFVLPSMIENSPNSLQEAMFIGTPVIASHVGGVMDYVEHYKNGFLYSSTAAYMLAFYIVELLKNPVMAMQFSENGYEKIKKILDRKKIMGDLNLVYEKIMAE